MEKTKLDYVFTEEDLNKSEAVDTSNSDKILCFMERDDQSGSVIITPANGKSIVVRGSNEAKVIANGLMDYFRR